MRTVRERFRAANQGLTPDLSPDGGKHATPVAGKQPFLGQANGTAGARAAILRRCDWRTESTGRDDENDKDNCAQ